MSAFRFFLTPVKIVLWVIGFLLVFLAALFGVLAKIGGTILYFIAVCTLLSVIIITFMNDFSTNSKLISWAAVIGFNVLAVLITQLPEIFSAAGNYLVSLATGTDE
ncbi:hypothetical protein Lpp78_16417 [Lacticaseibacillus paracasei subsp. paracasei CNCM I-2877]|nr:hypothetical protein Lpp78_16417 [Lacticaseibacillus paracasei subsp. paracasei CNCM I-2877]